MISPIDQLEESLWSTCVIQRAATDKEALERWQTDELAHVRERFVVRPMPAELGGLVQRALAQWQEREQAMCSRLGMTREQFLNEFGKLRQDYSNGGRAWGIAVQSMSPSIQAAVRNMDWVNLFAWVLPQADPGRALEHRMVGRMVAAIFYVELLAKHGNTDGQPALRKIEARWRLASQE